MIRSNHFLLSGVCILALSGCSWLSDWPEGNSRRAAAPVPAPQSKVMQTADGTWLAPLENQKPTTRRVPEQPGAQDMQERLQDLEQQVAQMRNDMSMMMPALTRLAEVQGDLQALLTSQIQPAAGDARGAVNNIYDQTGRVPENPATAAPTSMVKPQAQGDNKRQGIAPQSDSMAQSGASAASLTQDVIAKKTVIAPQKTAAPVTADTDVGAAVQPGTQRASITPEMRAGGGVVEDIRFGEHPDKTRIVLDTSDKVAFDYDVDNNEHILMLELGADWSAAMRRNVTNSGMVTSYSATPDGRGGTRLALQLKKTAEISWAENIPPAAGKGHRVVIDVAGR